MRLAELRPRWVTLAHWASVRPFFIALTFDCPCCRRTRLAVHLDPPVDPTNVAATFVQPYQLTGPAWRRQGESFETLTLQPSINVPGHWHGFVTQGEVC